MSQGFDDIIVDSLNWCVCLVQIINKDNAKEADREGDGYVIRDGILVLLPSAVIPDGTIL